MAANAGTLLLASALCLAAATGVLPQLSDRYITGHSNFNESMATCNKTYPISIAILILRMMNNGTLPDETNENARCFIECMERQKGTVNTDGTWNTTLAEQIEIDISVAHGKNHTEDIRKIMEECATMTGSGSCMTVYLIKRCIDNRMAALRGPFQLNKQE
ncbi:uncharacterized protein LOC124625247 [Schistocerca americana]|uniref:uncharacterized protein LOC124625247 n=1 Tax=Schistocerca americana TaxID=7009 RepID=UPI001F4F4043|nr:uncharacterized protein LOC124625247 [Schistocerca americana]